MWLVRESPGNESIGHQVLCRVTTGDNDGSAIIIDAYTSLSAYNVSGSYRIPRIWGSTFGVQITVDHKFLISLEN